MVARVEPPRQWEYWVSWGLGIWLMLSPWVLMFWTQTRAMENAVIAGFLLIIVEAVTLSAFRLWEEWVNVLIGLWLIVSPALLAMPGWAETINFVVSGILVVALAAYEMWDIRRRPAAR